MAVCMTEPHAGTDVANYRTNAAVKGDRVVLNGTKTLISRAREAGMFVVFTRIDGRPGREGIGCVLLEPDTPGFAVMCETFVPSRWYVPLVGSSRQPTIFMNVDLPEPEAPMTATNSPAGTSVETPRSACTSTSPR